MKTNKIIFIIIIITIIIFAIYIYFNFNNFFTINKSTEITEFVEVNDYEGEDFSSVDDFRENSIKGPQYINIEDYKLTIDGLVENSKSYSYEEVINNYDSFKKVATLNCVEGWSVKLLWEGVLISDLLKESIVKTNAKTIIFHAYDGYTTSFPVDYVLNNKIIMAYKMNNETLKPERGYPFQLVAESKWGYKWIKWITKIELSDNEDYKGYWESRGYSNSGNLDEGRFEK